MDAESLKIVRSVPLFAGLTDQEAEALADGEIREYQEGDILATAGAPGSYFYVNIEGEISIFRTYDNQEVLMGVNRPGGFVGEIFILLDMPWISTARVSTRARLFQLGVDGFWRMLSQCHSVAREVLRAAATRLRNMEGYSHQREKLISLGTMAAGLAHELNNPAAAARRASAHLRETVEQVQHFTCSLSRQFQPEHWRDLLNFEGASAERPDPTSGLSFVERSDREEAVSAWLESHQVPEPWKFAPTFVGAGVGLDELEQLTGRLPQETWPDALLWLESQFTLRSLLQEMEESTGRVSDLVKSMKSYTYMDRGPLQDVDVHEGLNSTLMMLKHKLKGTRVETEFAPNLPRIQAYGSELNQVWTNLIDNAIYAAKDAGVISIRTRFEQSHAVVEIMDNGGGIPADIQNRIFEPFFTTKGVGSGTGLGLVISHRIVADRHGGEIEFESRPGRTVFIVRLPVRPRPAGE